MHQFVQAVFDEGHQRFTPQLMAIGTEVSWFPKCHQQYLVHSDSLGVTMEDYDEHQKEFHIWITPAYRAPVFKFYMTLAHELVHGYAGLKYGHNAHWRRWFYRVLWHLNESKLIPEPESSLGAICWSVGRTYNRTGLPSVEKALIQEAFQKAKSEHVQVVENYWKRINA